LSAALLLLFLLVFPPVRCGNAPRVSCHPWSGWAGPAGSLVCGFLRGAFGCPNHHWRFYFFFFCSMLLLFLLLVHRQREEAPGSIKIVGTACQVGALNFLTFFLPPPPPLFQNLLLVLLLVLPQGSSSGLILSITQATCRARFLARCSLVSWVLPHRVLLARSRVFPHRVGPSPVPCSTFSSSETELKKSIVCSPGSLTTFQTVGATTVRGSRRSSRRSTLLS